MKHIYFCLYLSFIFSLSIEAQHFTKYTSVPWANFTDDSRAIAWVDYNRDGLQDIFITNGPSSGQNNVLYRNDGNGQFTKITGVPLVQDADPSDGATWADYNNDEYPDAFVANWYGQDNLLYKNEGGTGNFTKITSGPVGTDGGHSETGSWGDFDNDGYVDLYVTNSDGPELNFLYQNNGDGTFTSIDSGIHVNETGASRSVNWIDYDLDGDVDLFVTNEFGQANYFYRNDDTAFFKLSIPGLTTDLGNSQSSSWSDYDNDGDFDVFISNFNQDNRLYRNEGLDSFTSVLGQVISSDGGRSFGSNWSDIDNDGDEDLMVANAYSAGSVLYNFLYLNNGDGTFSKIDTGAIATEPGWTFGAAFGDYDLDGDMDLMCANNYNGAEANTLFQNQTSDKPNAPHWVTMRLKGNPSNLSGIGSLVILKAQINGQNVSQMRQISAQTGYCGQNMTPAHFGLDDAAQIDSVIIHWPSGNIDVLTNLQVDSNYVVLETVGTVVNLWDQSSLQSNPIKVFPNPSNGLVNIQFGRSSEKEIQIGFFDSMGKELQPAVSKKLGSKETTLEEIQLPKGKSGQLIFLRLMSQDMFESIPVILE